jgi:hypothetical protein
VRKGENSYSPSSSAMVGVDDVLAAPWPESRFRSLGIMDDLAEGGVSRNAGCCSVGGAMIGMGGLTTTTELWICTPVLQLEKEPAEETGRENDACDDGRNGFLMGMGMGASPGTVLS